MEKTDRLSDISVIRELLARHGFRFSKAMGQNFLINPSVCPRMAQEGGARSGVGVIEIGPGIGVLTVELARRAEKVIAIELDPRLMPVLAETLEPYRNAQVICGDVMKTDLTRLITEQMNGLQVVVCANLPYYITTPILMRLLEERLPVESITVMVQREAAQRICAQPGTREAGALSVAVHYYACPRVLFQVSRGSFMPAPNVDSTVIRLDVRKAPAVQVKEERAFFDLVRAAFGQRRKTLLNAVSAGFKADKEHVRSAMEKAGILPQARAEQLTMEDFARLSDELDRKKGDDENAG